MFNKEPIRWLFGFYMLINGGFDMSYAFLVKDFEELVVATRTRKGGEEMIWR